MRWHYTSLPSGMVDARLASTTAAGLPGNDLTRDVTLGSGRWYPNSPPVVTHRSEKLALGTGRKSHLEDSCCRPIERVSEAINAA